MKRKFWCVTSAVYDSGRITAAITSSIESDECPENTSTSTSRRDIYNDWFSDYDEAVKFVQDARRA